MSGGRTCRWNRGLCAGGLPAEGAAMARRLVTGKPTMTAAAQWRSMESASDHLSRDCVGMEPSQFDSRSQPSQEMLAVNVPFVRPILSLATYRHQPYRPCEAVCSSHYRIEDRSRTDEHERHDHSGQSTSSSCSSLGRASGQTTTLPTLRSRLSLQGREGGSAVSPWRNSRHGHEHD